MGSISVWLKNSTSRAEGLARVVRADDFEIKCFTVESSKFESAEQEEIAEKNEKSSVKPTRFGLTESKNYKK